MSDKEHEDYIGVAKRASNKSILMSCATILLSAASLYYGLKADAKEGRVIAHEELIQAVDTIKMDNERRDHRNDLQFQALWNAINSARPSIIYKYRSITPTGFYTQHKDPNGNLTFQAIK